MVTGPVWSQTARADNPLRPHGSCFPMSSPCRETRTLFLVSIYLHLFVVKTHKCMSLKIVLTFSKVLRKTLHFCRTSGLNDINKHPSAQHGQVHSELLPLDQTSPMGTDISCWIHPRQTPPECPSSPPAPPHPGCHRLLTWCFSVPLMLRRCRPLLG